MMIAEPAAPERETLREALPEVAVYVVLGLLGGYLIVTSFGHGLTSPDSLVGAGTMPLGMGVLLFGLASVLTFRRCWRVQLSWQPADREGGAGPADTEQLNPAVAEAVGTEHGDGTTSTRFRSRARCFWMVVAVLLATIVLTPLLSMQLAFGLMVLTLAVWVERMRLRTSVLVAVVAVVVSHLIFRAFLGVALPEGVLAGVF